MTAQTLTTQNSMLWWLDEPGGTLYSLDCYDADEFAETSNAIEVIRCWNQDHTGWDIIGETVAPAEKISVTVSFPRFLARSILESGDHCPGALIWTQNLCGRPDNFTGADIGEIMQHVRRTGRAFNAVANVADTPTRVTLTLEGWPPLLDIDTLEVARIVTTEVNALNDVIGNMDLSCPGDCGTTLGRGENVQIACDAAGGVTGNVLFSNDYAETFALSAPDPFAVSLHIKAVTQFPHGTGTRVLVGREGTGAVQGLMAFTDLLTGAGAWTTVNIGAIAVGEGPVYGHGIFALDEFHIWVASSDGFIFKSTDAGASFVAKESGAIHAGDNYFVHFADKTYGLVGGAAGVTSVSDDGGESWQAGGIMAGASPARCGWRFDDRRCLVGCDSGLLYESHDGGLIYALVPTGFPAASLIRSMWFVNDYQGFMAVDWAGPLGHIYRTNDGGASWQDLTYVTNVGLNSIWAPSASYCVAVGKVATTGVILKVNAAYV